MKIASSATISREKAVLSRLVDCTGFPRILGSGPCESSPKRSLGRKGGSMKERTKRDTSSVGGSVCGSASSADDARFHYPGIYIYYYSTQNGAASYRTVLYLIIIFGIDIDINLYNSSIIPFAK